MNNELISRDALNETIDKITWYHINAHGELAYGAHDEGDALFKAEDIFNAIDKAPTVEPLERIGSICEENCGYRPQGEYVDISKLRLMTVEECAGHTIDYAMGWKACIEWIKKGGAV